MEISVEKREHFEPIIFNVKCNTVSDLKVLYAMSNSSINKLLSSGITIGLTSKDLVDHDSALFIAVRDECEKLGLFDKE